MGTERGTEEYRGAWIGKEGAKREHIIVSTPSVSVLVGKTMEAS